MIVNQGMKRQPMAVYLIREIFSGHKDLPSADRDQLQNDGCRTYTTNSIDNDVIVKAGSDHRFDRLLQWEPDSLNHSSHVFWFRTVLNFGHLPNGPLTKQSTTR